MPYVTSFERLAKEEGLEEGLRKGREEGKQEGRQEGILCSRRRCGPVGRGTEWRCSIGDIRIKF